MPDIENTFTWGEKIQMWRFPELRINSTLATLCGVGEQEIENRTVESPPIVMLILWLSARFTINGNIKEILKLNET